MEALVLCDAVAVKAPGLPLEYFEKLTSAAAVTLDDLRMDPAVALAIESGLVPPELVDAMISAVNEALAEALPGALWKALPRSLDGKELAWLKPATAHVLPVSLNPTAISAVKLAPVLALISASLGDAIRARARDVYSEVSERTIHGFVLAMLSMGALGSNPQQSLDTLENAARARFAELDVDTTAEAAAALEVVDLVVARLMCDETGMTLWAVPESELLHTLCVAHAPIGATAIAQLREQTHEMRGRLLGRQPAPFGLVGADLHCSVGMSPVLLAILREASAASDLVRIALQFREEAEPFRRHLARLDTYQGEDLLMLADWRHELQSICEAVGRALGLRGPYDSGNVGTAVVECVGGNPVALVNLLSERAPSRARRHLLHPLYLSRKKAFLRRLVYDAILAPEMNRKLLKLFN
jgi:hypothetical protein